MKKLTKEKVISDAKSSLAGLLAIAAIFLYHASVKQDWFWFVSILLLALATDGYKYGRLLMDETYLKRYVIKKNDERNLQIEGMAYRTMAKILILVYTFLSGLFLGYFSDQLTVDQRGLIALGMFGLALLIIGIFHLVKWYYERQL